MKHYIGIDLGTTSSTVAAISLAKLQKQPLEELKQLPIYQYDEHLNPLLNEYSLASYLYIDIDHKLIYTGKYAKEMYSSGKHPMQSVQGVKMRLGNDSIVKIPSLKQSDHLQVFTMEQCSAMYLKTIRESIYKQIQHYITEAVITIPTAFTAEERQATINAAKLAGFEQVYLLDEPTAALNWHLHNEDCNLKEYLEKRSQNILVYDIGGGTLDISIANVALTSEGIKVTILGCSPRMDLGGNDFDQLLGAYFLYEYERARKDLDERNEEQQNRMIARLVSEAEKQKIAFNHKIRRHLSNSRRKYSEELVASFDVANNQSAYTVLTYEILEKIFSRLTDPIGKNTLTSAIQPALQKAGLSVSNIDEVVFTGGMSQFYVVEECVKDYFSGQNVRYQFIDYTSAVSKGAAIYHYSLYEQDSKIQKLIVEDKMAENVYLRSGKDFIQMIPHTASPGSKGDIFYTIRQDGLIEIPLFLYSGYGENPLEYTRLGGQFIRLKESMKKGDQIRINWSINQQKIIKLNIEDLGDLQIERASREISNQEAALDFFHTFRLNGNLFE